MSATTTRINYTLVFGNSMLVDDMAREKDVTNRRVRFTKMPGSMKILVEGVTLQPDALAGLPAPPPAAPPR